MNIYMKEITILIITHYIAMLIITVYKHEMCGSFLSVLYLPAALLYFKCGLNVGLYLMIFQTIWSWWIMYKPNPKAPFKEWYPRWEKVIGGWIGCIILVIIIISGSVI